VIHEPQDTQFRQHRMRRCALGCLFPFLGSIKIWREFKLAKKKEPYNFVHVLNSIVHETKIFVHLRQWREIEIKIRAQIWRFERGFLTSHNFQLYF